MVRALMCATTLAVCTIPAPVFGAVLINEIAWMGTVTSANDEWIELHNTGNTPVTLDGWTLRDGANLEISLTGTIVAGAYGTLERTDDTSASGPALLTYTGALSNAGATLILTRPDGSIEDQVAGGENWESVGGDNTTKETAQYTSIGWITGIPTPNAQNTSAPSTQEESEKGEAETKTSAQDSRNTNFRSGTNEHITLTLPNTALKLSIIAPERVYVHQPFEVEVIPSGIGPDLLDSVTYTWNFGDTHTGTQKEIEHTYGYPGNYSILVHGTFARHEYTARKDIVVLPVTFSLSYSDQGEVQIHNDAHYEVDMSSFVVQGHTSFTFPENSIVLPKATITVPNERIGGLRTSHAFLYDPEGTLVAYVGPETVSAPAPTPRVAGIQSSAVSTESVTQKSQSSSFVFDSDDGEASIHSGTATPIQLKTHATSSLQTTKTNVPENVWPYIGLIAVLVFGMVAVYFGKPTQSEDGEVATN